MFKRQSLIAGYRVGEEPRGKDEVLADAESPGGHGGDIGLTST